MCVTLVRTLVTGTCTPDTKTHVSRVLHCNISLARIICRVLGLVSWFRGTHDPLLLGHMNKRWWVHHDIHYDIHHGSSFKNTELSVVEESKNWFTIKSTLSHQFPSWTEVRKASPWWIVKAAMFQHESTHFKARISLFSPTSLTMLLLFGTERNYA